MTYRTLNTLLGWCSFIIALTVYMLTLEPSVSLWDCGEFIAASDSLQVVHPPGAPFFLMLGRLFIMLSPEGISKAVSVNSLSAVSSAAAVMFTFWTTSMFALSALKIKSADTFKDKFLVFTASMTAALALCFSDTFWFSAVEGEVYALSTFFTILNLWAALKWYNDNSPSADNWLLFISLMTGLAIGVHLLSLLVIPSLAFLYLFKHKTVNNRNLWITLILGTVVLFFVQNGVIPGIPAILCKMELLMVNSMGFGFDSGIYLTIFLIIGGIAGALYYFKNKPHLYNYKLATLCLMYILLGFSSYVMIPVRSREVLPIDMNNPEEPFKLKFYINREQYEERPLIRGAYFNSRPVDVEEGPAMYRKDETNYFPYDNKNSYVYESSDKILFPRMGDVQKESSPTGYRNWSGMGDVENQINSLKEQLRSAKSAKERDEMTQSLEALKAERPTFGNNLRFFWDYQVNHMYFRYMMWNFAGRQNDRQGHDYNRIFDGNWISGIPFLDHARLGNQDLPPELQNKGRNKFYLIPLILGILGIVLQYQKDRKQLYVNGILFLFTGLLIIVFLNQPPYEPRERDYVHVGSFMVFCIWIGLGVLFLFEKLSKKLSTTPALIVSGVVAFSAPYLMGQQGWDDHDRSKRYLALDLARNILASCPPNAIYFANADNDTYPLWYIQNAEKFRTDVRIINQNLLPTDWYSMQMMDKIYNSEPLPMSLKREQLKAGVNDYFEYAGDGKEGYINLADFVKNTAVAGIRGYRNNKYLVPVNKGTAINYPGLSEDDKRELVDTMMFSFGGRSLSKGDLVLLDVIATNAATGWKRPICFSTIAGSEGYRGLESYIERRGMIFQLVPVNVKSGYSQFERMNKEATYDLLMNQFRYGGIKEKPNFYIDDKAEIIPSTALKMFVNLAGTYVTEADKIKFEDTALSNPANAQKFKDYRDKARKLLDKSIVEIPEKAWMPEASIRLNRAVIYHQLGETDKSVRELNALMKESEDIFKYFVTFKSRNSSDAYYAFSRARDAFSDIDNIIQFAKQWNMKEVSDKAEKLKAPFEEQLRLFESQLQ